MMVWKQWLLHKYWNDRRRYYCSTFSRLYSLMNCSTPYFLVWLTLISILVIDHFGFWWLTFFILVIDYFHLGDWSRWTATWRGPARPPCPPTPWASPQTAAPSFTSSLLGLRSLLRCYVVRLGTVAAPVTPVPCSVQPDVVRVGGVRVRARVPTGDGMGLSLHAAARTTEDQLLRARLSFVCFAKSHNLYVIFSSSIENSHFKGMGLHHAAARSTHPIRRISCWGFLSSASLQSVTTFIYNSFLFLETHRHFEKLCIE